MVLWLSPIVDSYSKDMWYYKHRLFDSYPFNLIVLWQCQQFILICTILQKLKAKMALADAKYDECGIMVYSPVYIPASSMV